MLACWVRPEVQPAVHSGCAAPPLRVSAAARKMKTEAGGSRGGLAPAAINNHMSSSSCAAAGGVEAAAARCDHVDAAASHVVFVLRDLQLGHHKLGDLLVWLDAGRK